MLLLRCLANIFGV